MGEGAGQQVLTPQLGVTVGLAMTSFGGRVLPRLASQGTGTEHR
jgi:hypothetical protein